MNEDFTQVNPNETEEIRRRGLTPNEEVAAEERAFQAHQRRIAATNPLPDVHVSDIARTPDQIQQVIMGIIVAIPIVTSLIMTAALIISADKTYAIFSQHAATADWGLYRALIGICAVVMLDGTLIYVGFAKRIERIRKGAGKRKVLTLWSIIRAVLVRVGFVPRLIRDKNTMMGFRLGVVEPVEWDDLEDTNLNRLGGMMFMLALAVNVAAYVVPQLAEYEQSGAAFTVTVSQGITLGLGILMGIAAPFALETAGEQLATYGHRFFEEARNRMVSEARAEITRLASEGWDAIKVEAVAREKHRAWVLKNSLSETTPSPYLLIPGDGNTPGSAVPLASSQPPLLTTFSSNGNH